MGTSQNVKNSHKNGINNKDTDKKENPIFLIYKEIQNGAVAKSYMRNGFLIYEEMRKYCYVCLFLIIKLYTLSSDLNDPTC